MNIIYKWLLRNLVRTVGNRAWTTKNTHGGKMGEIREQVNGMTTKKITFRNGAQDRIIVGTVIVLIVKYALSRSSM